MPRSDRCAEADAGGALCLYPRDHGDIGHLYSSDRHADSFRLGQLQQAVKSFLAGQADRDFLAETLAETEADRAAGRQAS